MNEDIAFNISSTTKNNLRLLWRESGIVSEARICELSELAEALAEFSVAWLRDGFDMYEILSFVSEGNLIYAPPLHDDALEANRKRLAISASFNASIDKAILCDLFLIQLSSLGVNVTERSFLPTKEFSERFVYVKNALSDEAYDVFSQEFSDPRVKYAQTFKEAVGMLVGGEASYALLPLEERGGTRLHTVAELIYTNDLKINSVTPVFGQGADSDLKYALVSKTLVPQAIEPEDDRYLEIRLTKGSATALSGIILAAELYGIEIYRLNTVTFGKDDSEAVFYSLVFRTAGEDFTRLLTFLTVFTDDFVPVGMYKNLE